MNKYEVFPSPDTANYAVVSMGDIDRIKKCLLNFRKMDKNKPLAMNQGCSSTVLWSGASGNNVRVEVYPSPLGFVLHPEEIIVPYGDFFASGSSSYLGNEYRKEGLELALSDGTIYKTERSKFFEKRGGTRDIFDSKIGLLTDIFVTNHAKWDRSEQKYHDEGNIGRFSKALWRRYFKRHPEGSFMPANEVIAFQKGSYNPICGLLLRADKYSELSGSDRKQVIEILQENSHLNLYVYDASLEEHIMRVVGNQEAKELLQHSALKAKHLPPLMGYPDMHPYQSDMSDRSFECNLI